MSHPEIATLPPMVATDGSRQRPLTVAQLLGGERRALPDDWPQQPPSDEPPSDEPPSDEPPSDEPPPSLPAITTLAELEALADRPLFDDDPPAAEPAEQAARADEVALGRFEPAAIRCEPKLPTLSRAELHERITHDVLDRLTGLGEHRLRWPLADKAETERRVLAQVDALICLGSPALAVLSEAPAPSPWSSWAIVFALGCVDGQEPIASIFEHVSRLGPAQRLHRRRAAEAFAATSHPHTIPLARACLATAGCEPFGIELLSLRQQLQPRDLLGWLQRPDAETRATALRSLCRLEQPPADVPALEALLDTADPDLGWEAARALSLWGSGAPLAALRHGSVRHGSVRHGSDLLPVLGPQAIELLVLCGHLDDAQLVERLVRRLEPTAALLDTVARLGHPGTWAYLAHFLGDPVLADDAVAALQTTFGPLVGEDDRLDPDRWEQAIGALRLPGTQRVRAGQPWSLQVVAAECADPALSAQQVMVRLDELRARSHVHLPIPLWAFTPMHPQAATDVTAALRRVGAIR